MQPFTRGRYQARLAESSDDVHAALRLRWMCFIARNGHRDDGSQIDTDDLDAQCLHMLVEDRDTGQLVCCFRFLPLSGGSEIARSYSAQFYNLPRLKALMGRWSRWGAFASIPKFATPTSFARLGRR